MLGLMDNRGVENSQRSGISIHLQYCFVLFFNIFNFF